MSNGMERVGQQIGNYRLVRLLGEGGYAHVYLGQHLRLQSHVAIKILHTRLADEDILLFQQEAQTIERLRHDNIVRVLDFDVKDGIPFLVMDYAPNGSLRQRYPRNTLVPLHDVVSYVKQIASGLHYAHTQKIIHRDVKPDNMLIGQNGKIWISDFGIATLAHSTHSQSPQSALGTLSYMAPEQIQGHARPASDQYALGITVYEWLCGERPFHGTIQELLAQHNSTPPPSLCTKVPTMTSEVEKVVLTALAKDSKQRFESIEAFANEFEQAATVKPTTLLDVNVKTLPPTVIVDDQETGNTSVPPAPSNPTQKVETLSGAVPSPKQTTAPQVHQKWAITWRDVLILIVAVGMIFGTVNWWFLGPQFLGQSYAASSFMPTGGPDSQQLVTCSFCLSGASIGLDPDWNTSSGDSEDFTDVYVNHKGKYIITVYLYVDTSIDNSDPSVRVGPNGDWQEVSLNNIGGTKITAITLNPVTLHIGSNTIRVYNSGAARLYIDSITVVPISPYYRHFIEGYIQKILSFVTS